MPSQSQGPGQKIEQGQGQSHRFSPEQRIQVDLLHAHGPEIEQLMQQDLNKNPAIAPFIEFIDPNQSNDNIDDFNEYTYEPDHEKPFDDYPESETEPGAQDWESEQADWQRREDVRSQVLEGYHEANANQYDGLSDAGEDSYDFDQAAEKSTADMLDEQIMLLEALTAEERTIARAIVQSLDGNGLFRPKWKEKDFDEKGREIPGFNPNAPENILSMEEFSNEIGFDSESVAEVLRYLQQRLEPAGIGAIDVRECILLQLQRKRLTDSLAYKMLNEHYADCSGSVSPVQLGEKLGVSPAEIQEAFAMIKKETTQCPVIADTAVGSADLAASKAKWARNSAPRQVEAVLHYVDGEWIVFSDRHILPIRIHPDYLEIRERGATEIQNYIRDARKWIKKWDGLLAGRQSQMIPILEALAAYQSDYLLGRASSPRPLTYEKFAKMVTGENGNPLHKSTPNRAAQGKWIATPRGVIEIQELFREKTTLKTEQGKGDLSQNEVKKKLKQLVDDEDKLKPLSDQRITDKLNKQGIPIKLRTVTKYRGQLNIPNTRVRKRH